MKGNKLFYCVIGTLLPLLMLFGGAIHHHDNEEDESHCIVCSTGAVDRRRDNAVASVLHRLAPGGRGGHDLVPAYIRSAVPRATSLTTSAPLQVACVPSRSTLDLIDSATSSPRNLWLYEDAPAKRGPPRQNGSRAPPCTA